MEPSVYDTMSVMKRTLYMFLFSAAVFTPLFAGTNVVGGMKIVCEDGICTLVEEPSGTAESPDAGTNGIRPRMAQGFMTSDEFISFIENGESGTPSPLENKAWWLVSIIVLFGGLCMNLTPCILPMMPVNLMIIGRSAFRGALYGLGIALAYGLMGVLAAVGGLAFGAIQGNPWFNAAIAILFSALALSTLGVFHIDFSRNRNAMSSMRNDMWPGFFAFFMGVVSAVLAGACVAPILITVLLLTADLFAKGNHLTLALPFILGIGMALPWPFAGAGLKILPKPGAWMSRVSRFFGVAVLCFAAWYGHLAWKGFTKTNTVSQSKQFATSNGKYNYINIASPGEFNLNLLKKPVLVDCWASWCKNCSAMDRTTLSDDRVINAIAGKGFTFVKLQAEDISELKRLPGFEKVIGLPAFLIFQ